MMAESKGRLEPQNWLSPRAFVHVFPSEPRFPERSAKLAQFSYVVPITSSKTFLVTTFRSYLKGKMKDSPHDTVFSAPFPDNLYHQLAICHILSDVSVGMPSTSPPREVSSGRAGFSVRTSVSSASIGLTCSRHSANPSCIREQRNAGQQPSSHRAFLTNPPMTLVRSSRGPLCLPHADQSQGAPVL